MDNYVTGAVIRKAREEKHLTQEQLAAKLHVSSKAVSKWETGAGFPDISLLEPLAKALELSVIELLAGAAVRNCNRSSNLKKAKVYVCPVCGNVLFAFGEAVVSCCGLTLPPLEAEDVDEAHAIRVTLQEDQFFVTVDHPMEKDHFVSFLAAVSDRGVQFEKLYPEGPAQAYFSVAGVRMIFACCNRHGLFSLDRKRF